MPSNIHKKPIVDEVRKSMPKELHDLAIGGGANKSGLITQIYQLLNHTLGSLELAFLRGQQCGVHEAYKGICKEHPEAAKALSFEIDDKNSCHFKGMWKR